MRGSTLFKGTLSPPFVAGTESDLTSGGGSNSMDGWDRATVYALAFAKSAFVESSNSSRERGMVKVGCEREVRTPPEKRIWRYDQGEQYRGKRSKRTE
ncbi:CIC11C00000003528 [Sungouiella intermedia]|uniref:CIC11C00000003528 n=1 Tax=Sungouiella intermedia TaxID=45354 RepID=A0A1L0BXF6_9ASCO|nr:CIC11C00000003528 [[Candida] intermedia]